MEKPKPSNLAWAILGASVVTYDILAPEGETMSEAVDRALERPVGRILAVGAVALTSAHLLNVFDRFGVQHLDPVHMIANLGSKRSHFNTSD